MTTNESITRAVQVLQTVTKASNTDVGNALGVAAQQVVNRKNGRTRWSVTDLDALSVYFRIPAAAFLEAERVVQSLPRRGSGKERPSRELTAAG